MTYVIFTYHGARYRLNTVTGETCRLSSLGDQWERVKESA